MKRILFILCLLLSLPGSCGIAMAAPPTDDPSPPPSPVKLIFIHHSTGGNWLADPNSDQPYGGLGRALMENNYFVSATNYGWGPDSIGDRTDIPNWPEWFTGPDRDTYLEALYNESDQNFGDFGSWSRLSRDPDGENEIVMFKSCFPNSDLYGSPGDPPLDAPNDYDYTVANAKAVYINLLTYFETRPDKLFIVITAPPLMRSETAPDRAANARAFNNWLVSEWLKDYPYPNVAVFDYYNVLTAEGNHHRWTGTGIEHVQAVDTNFSAYPSGDSHPSTAGHQKATAEFVPLLNVYYNRWKAGAVAPPPPVEQPATPAAEPTAPPAEAAPPPAAGVVDDFEAGADLWSVDIGSEDSGAACETDGEIAHGGTQSLRMRYDIAPQSWIGCGRYFDSPQDWSSGSGLSLWLRSEEAGRWVTLALFSGDPDGATPFEIGFEVAEESAAGWVPLTFAWSDFVRASWADAGGLDALDPARVTGLGFSLGTDDERSQGRLWLDDLALAAGAPPAEEVSEAEETAEAEEAQPPSAAEEEPAPAEEKPGGGLCPSATLALPVVGIAFAGLARRRARR